MRQSFLFVWLLWAFACAVASAEEAPKPAAKTVEQLADAARKSVVVITVTGRDGKKAGIGTGFVVGADGLIATNLHVIGEGRPFTVETADGKRHEVVSVHASDRGLDLALVRINAKELTPLELGDSDTLKDGQPVVALGNPQGLKHSVVSGVVSGKREIDGRQMIQLAIPVEPGNSGGPLLDMQGRVHGMLTMKSLVTANLGFAVGINSLRPLLQKPNPVPMARWLTIGALDPAEWVVSGGAQWRQRAGRILVEGAGAGFAGRSLCLAKEPPPDLPYEVAVTVKLDDESGAAGLVFHADGGDRHYGFYPSNGRLRFTRFDGPDVFSWKVLKDAPSPHYRPGEWNTLKVRVEKNKIICQVNDQPFLESTDDGLTEGKVGLAKFRDTQAEFKRFEVGKQVSVAQPPAEVAARIMKTVEALPGPKTVEGLSGEAASPTVLRDRARQLEQQAARLRDLAQAVHQKQVEKELLKTLAAKEDQIDLLHAALLIARLDNDELDIQPYRREVDRMAKEVTATIPKDADDAGKIAALNKYLFTERGFHGSRGDYYHRSNSDLNAVIDDREGLPITLAVLYLEVGRRLGLKLEGVGLPGHFMVRHVPARGEPQLIDVFEGGKLLTREEAEKRVQEVTGRAIQLKEEHFAAVTKRAIASRMLQNLMGIARDERNAKDLHRYVEVYAALNPDEAEERWMRAVLRFQAGQRDAAREDVDWLLERHPEGIDLGPVRELKRVLERGD